MPFDSNGNASLVPGYRAVEGQTILPSQHNPVLEDIANMLSQTLLRSGAAPLSGNLSASGYKITNAAEGSADGDYVTMSQLNDVIASVVLAQLPTGAVQGFDDTTAPTGWVKRNGGTIGSVSSGATTRAHADTQALFVHLWTKFDNTKLPIQTSGGVATTRGASAAADFAANKRMPLFDSRSRFHRAADDGLGFDATLTVGATQADGIKNHKHPGTTEVAGGHTPRIPKGSSGGGDGAQNGPIGAGFINGTVVPDHDHDFTTDDNTGGLALETRPRASVLLYCIKL